MKIKLPNGKEIEGQAGKKIIDLIGKDKRYLAAKVDGKLVDLTTELTEDVEVVEILDFNSKEGREVYWHTSSHILAQAVKELFPNAKLAIGPAIDEGFYYDFDLDGRTFTPEDLERIEERAKEVIKRDIPLERKEMTREEAIEFFQKLGEIYKVELLQEIEDEKVTVYWQGDFVDLCRGPHLPSTGYVKQFKVLHSSSAYWRGDEHGPVLQRIYGISFPKKSMLDEYIHRIEEAKRRDHRKLGKELDLFSIHNDIGPGLVLWHPKGAMVRHIIEQFWIEEHLKRGYQLVYTPHIGRSDLWKTSGHLDFYRENMYAPMQIDEIEYFIKPMNCPFH
ncbi:MAG: threonine--tRNA ligase, partial [Candidatus Hydrothermota bacterium]